MAIIQTKEMLDWLERAGIIPEQTNHVIIDIPIDGPVIIYATIFGTDAMIEVEPPPELKSAEVRIVRGLEAEEK